MLDLFLVVSRRVESKQVSSAPTMVLCAEDLLGLGPGPGSLVARWCSGLARVENNDPANDGLWTPETRKRPIDGSSNLPRATIFLGRICTPVQDRRSGLEQWGFKPKREFQPMSFGSVSIRG